MARPLRIEFPDAAYHVTARGNERRDVFRSDQDRQLFLDTLAEMAVLGVTHKCAKEAWRDW